MFNSCRNRLMLVGNRDYSFHIPLDSDKKEIFRYKVRLPPYLTCSQCVVQWTYYTGIENNNKKSFECQLKFLTIIFR